MRAKNRNTGLNEMEGERSTKNLGTKRKKEKKKESCQAMLGKRGI